jgi:hypothetical protein
VEEPPSIFQLPPLESGGENARQGFGLQDHVAAGFCIKMISEPNLEEVWCETQDDITLIRVEDDGRHVEFVQVKGGDLDHHWSVSTVCERKNQRVGTSIVERSLAYDRCRETCSFTIVTALRVNSDLEILTSTPESLRRQQEATALHALHTAVLNRIGEVRSPNGHGLDWWLRRTVWAVVHSIAAVSNQNQLDLQAAIEGRGEYIARDQLYEIYINLVSWVSRAALTRYKDDPEAKKIKKPGLQEWIDKMVHGVLHAAPGECEGLRTKMEDAGLPADTIAAAQESRAFYRREVLSQRYLSIDDRKLVEAEVAARLHALKAGLDAGQRKESGLEFHNSCLQELQGLAAILPSRNSPPLAFLQGCMYSITGRCIHRFRRPDA